MPKGILAKARLVGAKMVNGRSLSSGRLGRLGPSLDDTASATSSLRTSKAMEASSPRFSATKLETADLSSPSGFLCSRWWCSQGARATSSSVS